MHSDFLLIIEKFLVSFLENALRGHAIMYAVLVLHSLSLLLCLDEAAEVFIRLVLETCSNL